MVDAMANSVVTLIPDALGPQLPIITALLSMPFTFFMSNDAFYFGVLPILTKAAATYGISAAEMGRLTWATRSLIKSSCRFHLFIGRNGKS